MKLFRNLFVLSFVVVNISACSGGGDSEKGTGAQSAPPLNVDQMNSKFMKMSGCRNVVIAEKVGPNLEEYKVGFNCSPYGVDVLEELMFDLQVLKKDVKWHLDQVNAKTGSYSENEKNFLQALMAAFIDLGIYQDEFGMEMEGLKILKEASSSSNSKNPFNVKLIGELLEKSLSKEDIKANICKYAKIDNSEWAKIEAVYFAEKLITRFSYPGNSSKIDVNYIKKAIYGTLSFGEIEVMSKNIAEGTSGYTLPRLKELLGAEYSQDSGVQYAKRKSGYLIVDRLQEVLKLDCLMLQVFQSTELQNEFKQGKLKNLRVLVDDHYVKVGHVSQSNHNGYQYNSLEFPMPEKLNLNTVDPTTIIESLLKAAKTSN